MKPAKILAIETSCDETAVAVIAGNGDNIKILSNVVFSQIPLHRKYFGVYPELASRAHLEKILPVFEKALTEAKTIIQDIDAIAVTVGPGLIGSLLVGVNFAKTLSFVFQKPIIAVNHIEGHIYTCFASNVKVQSSNVKRELIKPQFPLVALVVSGGHTLLALMKDHLKYQILGETLDDAAGEAFDKVAKILGLGYPGGPEIERIAQESKLKTHLRAKRVCCEGRVLNVKTEKNLKLPRPMIESKDFNFSFSGLKTAVLQIVKEKKYSNSAKGGGCCEGSVLRRQKSEIAGEFQQAVVDVLVEKTVKAFQKYQPETVILSGGVAANSHLRRELNNKLSAISQKPRFFVPEKSLCTDNAVGIATAGYYKLLANQVKKWYDVDVKANLKLGE